MARIPTYRAEVEPSGRLNAPRQSGGAPAAAFGGQEAQVLATAGQAANAFAVIRQQERDKDDKAWVSSALAGLSSELDGYMFGDDTREGVVTRKGENAQGATKTAKADLDQIINTSLDAAPSENAKTMFNERALSLRVSTSRSIARHESAEVNAWRVQSRADNVVAQSHRISANHKMWEAEEIEAEFNDTMLPDIKELAKLKGEKSDRLERENRSALYTDIITQNVAEGGVDKARTLLTRWESDLDADTRARLTSSIVNKKAKLDGQQLAEDLFHNPKVSYKDAMDKILGVKNPDKRAHARTLYNAYRYNQKQIEMQEFNEGTDAAYTRLEQLVGDLVNQQKLVSSMPEDTTTQRKVKAKAKSRLSQYKAAKGLSPMTDPATYDAAMDAINYGKTTDTKALRAQFGDKVTDSDMKDLERILTKSQRATVSSIHTAYSFAIGRDGEPDVKLSESERRDRGAFALWAKQMTKDTNRAQDEGYMQSLADRWVMEGERKRRFTPGYGKDTSLGEALRTGRAESWLPDTPDVSTVTQIEEVFKLRPDVKKAWMDQYGQDEDLAVRAYYKQLTMQQIGPRTK